MTKKISKLIAVLLSILILLGSFPALAALKEGNEYEFERTYLNAYYSNVKYTDSTGHNRDRSGQVFLLNLKSTGEPVYCIEFAASIDGSAATASDIRQTDTWNNLSLTAQNGIKIVSIYGYPNNKWTYSATEAQLATTILIWEFETGLRTDYSAGCTSAYSSVFNNYEDALNCYNKILEVCRNHATRPNFGVTTVKLKGVGESNATTLTDRNGVLSNFKVSSSNSNVKVSQTGNSLKIWSNVGGTVTAALTLTKKNTDINSAFALTGANQTLLYGTLSDPVTTRLNVQMDTATIRIVKQSEDGVVEGFHFTVNGTGYANEVITDRNGVATCTVPVVDNYYIVREALQPGQERYEQPDRQNVPVTAGGTATVYFNNTTTKGKAIIEKKGEVFSTVTYSEETQSYQPVYEEQLLPNAVYDVCAGEDIINASGAVLFSQNDVVETVTTGADGTAQTSDLPLKVDGTAKYYFVENTAPAGCVLDETHYDFELSKADNALIASVSVTDARQRAQILFNKELETDEVFGIGTNNEIEAVTFGLYAAEDLAAADGSVIPENGLIELVKVNPDTTVTAATDLPHGSYYYQEIETDEHYVLSDIIYPFTFTYDEPLEEIITIDLTEENGAVENKLKRGRIEGLKIDDNGAALEGALIGLFRSDETDFSKESAILTVVSDKDGKFCFENVPFGKYIIKEIVAPEGFTINDAQFPAVISENNETIRIDITDILIRGTIQGIKIDNNGAALEGALIGLFGADETDFSKENAILTDVSGKDGKFCFTNVPYGKYLVKEIEAPEGYKAESNVFPAEISKNGAVVYIEIVNTLIPKVIREILKSPETGNLFNMKDIVVLLTILLVVLVPSIALAMLFAAPYSNEANRKNEKNK